VGLGRVRVCSKEGGGGMRQGGVRGSGVGCGEDYEVGDGRRGK